MRTVVITGAAGGFGRGLMSELLERGDRVYAVVRGGAPRLRALGEALLTRKLDAGLLTAIDLDLRDFAAYPAAITAGGLSEVERIDVLFNIAGYAVFGPVADVSLEELSDEFAVNVYSPVMLIQALLPALIRSRGRIINMGSLMGRLTFPLYGNYSASKHALAALSEALAFELAAHGVQVGLIEPSGYQTHFKKGIQFTARSSGSRFAARVRQFRHVLEHESDRYLGDPKEVVDLMLALCEVERLELRYPIGKSSGWLLLLKRVLPGGTFNRLVSGVFDAKVFRDHCVGV